MKELVENNLFVSIIIPCRNEERFIGKCLDSLIKNNFPKKNLEILVYDGNSTDKTVEIIKNYEQKYNFIKLYNNLKQFPSFALNQGIKQSRGDIIIRCDAHAEYDKNYISKLVYWLLKDKSIGSVGGLWINKPANNKLKTKSIALALGHKFCVGPNKYRTGVKEPQEVDTVPFGAWRREVINKVGLFNKKFIRAQDLEFNIRLKKAGYKIILDPEIKIYYYPRENYTKLFRMMFQYGYWKNIINKELKILSSNRQLVPPIFVIYVIFLPFLLIISYLFIIPLFFYLFLIIFFSLLISINKKDLKLFLFNIYTFTVVHVGYGLGYIKGFYNTYIRPNSKYFKKEAELTR